MSTGNDPILSEIERFMADRGMTATAFGTSSVNDPRLVFDLREGRELRRSTRVRVETFMQGKVEAAVHTGAP